MSSPAPGEHAGIWRALLPYVIAAVALVLGIRLAFHWASRHAEDLGGGIFPLGLLVLSSGSVLVAAVELSAEINLALWGVVGLAFVLFLGSVHGSHGAGDSIGNGVFVGALLLVVIGAWTGIRSR